MIYARLSEQASQRTALISAGETWTYERLLTKASEVANLLRDLAGQQVVVALPDAAEFIVALMALDQAGASAIVLPGCTSAEKAERVRADLGAAATLRSPVDAPLAVHPAASGHERGRVILFTSGTSGEPKPVVHTWQTLAAAVHTSEELAGRRWLLAYEPSKFAGLQVLTQALFTGGCLVVPAGADGAQVAAALAEHDVEFASGTPTFWRMVMQGAPPGSLDDTRLQHVTLGGEAVDQSILDGLATTFPNTRLTHIYASTEMGACFSVHDGRHGFPLAYLSDSSLPSQLRIDDGELFIRSNRAMTGYLDDAPGGDWFATGDLVHIVDDRVLFVGRRSDAINVGGLKVYPLEIEELIREIDGVREVRVHGIRSSMVGELVIASVRPSTDAQHEDLRAAIVARCRDRLPKHKIPARISFVSELATNDAGKLSRLGG